MMCQPTAHIDNDISLKITPAPGSFRSCSLQTLKLMETLVERCCVAKLKHEIILIALKLFWVGGFHLGDNNISMSFLSIRVAKKNVILRIKNGFINSH